MRTRPPGVSSQAALAPHTSLKVGGPADFFAVARSTDELVSLLGWARAEDLPVRCIGGGSNLLVAEAGADGLVVKLGSMGAQVLDREGEPVLVADAGATLASVSRRVSKQGYGGLEWAATVPGTVGGAAVNNAGAFGGDTASCLVAVTIVDAHGTSRRLAGTELGYGYRTSVLKRRELGDVAVVAVELRLARSTSEVALALIAANQEQRTRSQPRQLSAGSVFANPPGDFAGRLIEEAGLKGTRIGGAEISRQHGNFFVNVGGATAADVYALLRLAQQTVFGRSSVWLHPEIELFGRWTVEERQAVQRHAG